MNTELIIKTSDSEAHLALLKDGRLTELHKEQESNEFSVGDIFLAKVRKPISGLNAAFVDVGHEKAAFLHYQDLGPRLNSLLKFIKGLNAGTITDYSLKNISFEPEIERNGRITSVLRPNQSILVQIVKEPISTKGPRVSSELSLAGRYMVLVPFSNRISISQKIGSREEKERLKRLVSRIKPKGFGVIIRTVAQGIKVAALDSDLQHLVTKWKSICKKIPKATPPSKVFSEMSRASAMIRDLFNDQFTGIHVDESELYLEIKDYVKSIAPDKESIVKQYRSMIPIFEKYGIERQIKTSFGKTVSMKKGVYLVIEHTEALHVIDVNSGVRSNKVGNQEDAALEVNLIAATEIARQLRLRDMGGIVVIDFIDMINSENRKKLFNHFREVMKSDRAKHKILPPSKFGLVQLTRQRVRPVMNITTREKNPNKNETIEPPIVLISKIQTDLNKLLNNNTNGKKISISTHPFVAAYLTKGVFLSVRFKWFLAHKKWIKIFPRDAYTYLEYHFHDDKGNVLKI